MKRRKKLWIMSAVLGLVLILTVGVSLMDRRIEQIRESGEAILEIPADSVTALSWDHSGETLAFTKDETWHYTGDPDFPISDDEILQMLSVFEEMTAAFRIEQVQDYSPYGLTEPECTISLTAADQTYTIRVGSFSKMDQQRYVDIGDGNVYLLMKDPMTEFGNSLSNVIQHDAMPVLEDADRITFSGMQNYSIVRDPENGKSLREDDNFFADTGDQLQVLDPYAVQRYLSNLENLKLTDYKTYTASQEDLSLYGLDAPELTLTAEYPDEDGQHQSITLYLSRNSEEVQEAEASENGDTAAVYARLKDSELVYKLASYESDKVLACSYNDLRHTEIFPADSRDIQSMTFTLEGTSYPITGQQGDDDTMVFTFGGQEIDAGRILSNIEGLRAVEFTNEIPGEHPELQLEVTLMNGEQTSLTLLRKDGENCVAVVDGTVTALVSRAQMDQLREEVYSIVLGPFPDPT